MIRYLIAVLALVGLSACTPTTTISYPENFTATNCFTGSFAFDLEVQVPRSYGQVLALTQHSNDSSGLRTVCRLVPDNGPFLPGNGYPIYTGEVDNGRDGICVSARTTQAGHLLSCASAAQVRRAMTAPMGSNANVIRLSQWQTFGS